MKKLICAKDVEACAARGDKTLAVDANTLITPSARDAAAAAGIDFCEGAASAASTTAAAEDAIIARAVALMLEKGLLGQLAGALGIDVPYVSEGDGALKLVRGQSAKTEPLATDNPAAKVWYNTLIGDGDGARMSAGFLTIDASSFSWQVASEEIYVVIEGQLTVEKNGKTYTAVPGDCLLFKAGQHLRFGAAERVKVFYVTQ
ncbi:MAG: cupin domain-containing protein [Peptococcaceae bacterium]|nr:cupin domain-containing protein [Peptococcaceae bacterium]